MPQTTRNIGYVERVFLCRNVEDTFTNFNVTAKLNIRFTPAQMSNALSMVVKKDHWLAYNGYKASDVDSMTTSYSDWELRTVQKIKFNDVVSFEQVETFDKNIFDRVNKLVPPVNVENLPLWRIIVFEVPSGEQYVCIYFCHTLYDGTSGVEILKSLCDELSKFADAKPLEYIFDIERDQDYLPETPIPPNEEDGAFKPTKMETIFTSLGYLFPSLVKIWDYVLSWTSRFHPDTTKNPFFRLREPQPSHDSRFLLASLTADQVKKIIYYCRTQGITLTPYVQAVALKCIEDLVLSKYEKGSQFSTETAIAIDSRRFLHAPQRTKLGCKATVQYFKLPPINNNSTNLMRHVSSALKKTISGNGANVLHFLGMVRNLTYKQFLPIVKPERHTLLISNVGRAGATTGAYKIADLFFGQSVALRYYMTMSLASASDGGMNAVISYFPEFDKLYDGDHKVMDIFAEEFERRLVAFPGEN